MANYSFEGLQPKISASAYVHPSAVLIGDVVVDDGCYIGPGASLRGDFGRIIMNRDANLQDNCVVHGTIGSETIICSRAHIGHGAVVHGCILEEDVLVGMNAVVMDDSVIGARSIIGSCAMVKANFTCSTDSLIIGIPAKAVKTLTSSELKSKRQATQRYIDLAKRSLQSMRAC